ncbi:MAG: hypothetical protein HZB85_03405 [Deltaproteobacteria bacterium]|nr:hypothetical protein [Deltaproteobacteria bacterium]
MGTIKNKMKINNTMFDLGTGIIFLVIGLFMLANNKRLADAMNMSNEVFWEKLNLFSVKGKHSILTRIVILLLGAVFTISGIVVLLKWW